MFNKLYAVCLLVENLNKSLVFYRDILELEVNAQDIGYIDFKLGDTLLAIFQKDAAIAMFSKKHMTNNGGNVLAFKVQNMNKICNELKQKGVIIFEGPKKTPWGQEVAYFKDPDDNIWEITTG